MKNLLNPNIQFTDPDTLQFCLPLSDKEFWYCEPNCSHEKLLPESDSNERIVYDILCGYPEDLLEAILDIVHPGKKMLATIITRKGSAPRNVGSKMLILEDGSCVGTIGGGCMEAEVLRKLREQVRSQY